MIAYQYSRDKIETVLQKEIQPHGKNQRQDTKKKLASESNIILRC
jgi:hypothetical protein